MFNVSLRPDNIYADNFDLAAYITDNDIDFQTTVDHTEEIVQHHLASTIDHCSTSMLVSASTVDPVSMHATPATSQSAFAVNNMAPAVAQLMPEFTNTATLCTEPTDTYHYVEQWLESCLQGDESTVETINAVAGVMGVSPIKLERRNVIMASPESGCSKRVSYSVNICLLKS